MDAKPGNDVARELAERLAAMEAANNALQEDIERKNKTLEGFIAENEALKPNPQQQPLIRAAIRRLPMGSEVVAAMGADEDGRKLADAVRETFEAANLDDLRFRIQEPTGFKDFNDQLRAMHTVSPAPCSLTAGPI
jgi:predicted phage gp36 major capsid-like protein